LHTIRRHLFATFSLRGASREDRFISCRVEIYPGVVIHKINFHS
jgi:hypothetical protein